MVIPEIEVHKSIEIILALIKKDFETNPEEDTVLYRVFNDKKFQRYNIYDQCKSILLSDKKDNVRALDDSCINLAFNPKVSHLPSIHITTPSGQPKGNPLNVGEGIGEIGEYERREANTLSVVVTSENYLEVLALYNVLKAMFIRIYDHFSLVGLENLTISHREININPELVPKPIYAKAILFGFELDLRVFDFKENREALQFDRLIFDSELFPESIINTEE